MEPWAVFREQLWEDFSVSNMEQFSVEVLDLKQWSAVSESAHLACFNESRPATMDRVDFTLMYRREKEYLAYCTVMELNEKACYWQFGGSFPPAKGTVVSFKAYQAFLDSCFDSGYLLVATNIESENIPMLKMAFKVGFRIVGTKYHEGKIFVELVNERKN